MRRVISKCCPARALGRAAVLATATTCAPLTMSRAPMAGGAPPAPPGGMQMPPPSGAEAPEGAEEPRGPVPKPEQDPKFFTYEVDAATGFCTLSLGRKPVNSLSMEFMEELNHWLAYMGDEESIKAVILTSNIPSIFSAGLDINELYQAKEERFAMFWSSFQHLFITLHTFPKPVIAAVNGNAPAGGCIMAMCCDYRIMTAHPEGQAERPYRIGLNETKLGIAAPAWAMANMAYIVGRRTAERMLQLGETPTSKQALAVGLVDELAEDSADLKVKAAAAAKRFTSVNPQARWLTRDMLRGEVLHFLAEREGQEQDMQFAGSMIMNDDVQKGLGAYLARLQAGSAAKKKQ